MTRGTTPLTWLYVPADRPDRVVKALGSGAHAVIVDLEDAVPPEAKVAAREGLGAIVTETPGVRVQIRVNALGTPWVEADLQAASRLPVGGVTLPKTESAGDVDAAARLLGNGARLNCLIETALGVEHAFEIASSPHVDGISLGEVDLRSQTGAGEAGLDWARARIINAASAAGLPRPPQSLYPNVADLVGLAASCVRGRELGFLGRIAIHPRQLPVIEQAYLPTVAELARARELIETAAGRPEGAFALDGEFVDAPIVASAQQVVALAERYGTRSA
jgi:citrate lyase subunit beta/citryl-CoA lyase